MPPRLSPAPRRPGRADVRTPDAAGGDRRWLRLAFAIAVAMIAMPGLILMALARLQGERR